MPKDKKLLLVTSALLPILFFLTLFIKWSGSKFIVAALGVTAAITLSILIKKRTAPSINNRQVLLLVSVSAVLFLILLYLSGISFGFYKARYVFSFKNLYQLILPSAAIIVSTEIIRSVLVSQQNRYAEVSAYFIGVISELALALSAQTMANLTLFMDFVGISLLPAVTANLLYNYLAKRYGRYPSITARLVLSLYAFLIPVVPATPEVLRSFALLLFPILVFVFIDALFEKKRRFARHKKSKLGPILSCISTLIMISVVMLISCKFRYSLIVIGSESMTGAIDKGDAIIYERYESQIIQVGDVIVFDKGGVVTVHRVVKIERLNNANRYYTKGDYNPDLDMGYRTDADVIGVTDLKIPSIGYPTVWLNELFSK